MLANGYEFKTTFWNDFLIANAFGINAVRDTFKRAFNEWKNDVTYCAELCLVCNWMCWKTYEEGKEDFSTVYRDCYDKVRDYGYSHFKGDDFQYFWSVLD